MKLTLTYGASFDLIITTIYGEYFTYEMTSCALQDAVDYAEMIFGDGTPLRKDAISKVTICDTETGEICAECERDPVEEASPADEDWGYNEDMGFDPYLGCYTDDC